MEYASAVWHGSLKEEDALSIERTQSGVARCLLKAEWCTPKLGGSEKKEGGGGGATVHRCILRCRCLTQPAFESGNPTHALNMLRKFEVITTTHCTVFVLPRLLFFLFFFFTKYLYIQKKTQRNNNFLVFLFVSPSTHLDWLCLYQTVDHNQMSMAFRRLFLTLFLFWLNLVTHRNRSDCRYDSYECGEHGRNGPPAASDE